MRKIQLNNMLKKLFMAASVSFADLSTGNLSYKMTDSVSLDLSLASASFDVYSLYSVYYRAKDIKIGGLILAQATGWSDIIAIMSFSPSLSVPVSIVYNHCPSLSFGYDIAMSIRYLGLKFTDSAQPIVAEDGKSLTKEEAASNTTNLASAYVKGNAGVNDRSSFGWLPIASFFVEYNFGIFSGKYHLGQALYAYNIYSLKDEKARVFTYGAGVFSVLYGLEFKLNICHGWIANVLVNSIYRSVLTLVIWSAGEK